MVKTPSKLKDRAVKRAINTLRKDKRVEAINLGVIANELEVSLEELQTYYSSAEDIFGDEQTFPFVAGLGKNAAH